MLPWISQRGLIDANRLQAMDSVKGWDLELWTEGKACDHVAPIPMLVDHFEGNE